MGAAGFFQDERVELLEGEILSMSPKLSQHAFAVNQLTYALVPRLGSTAVVRFQDPVVLDDWSEPEPDVAVCEPVPDRYASAHPRADEVRLIIEVAESSLSYDRTRKAQAYAAAGIAEYWIVNLVDRWVEVRADPDPITRSYRQQREVRPGNTLAVPGDGTIAVTDILP